MSLSLALRYVLDATKKAPGTKMYLFGIAALEKFKSRLKEFAQYCINIAAIPHFQQFPSVLKQVCLLFSFNFYLFFSLLLNLVCNLWTAVVRATAQ